MAMQACRECGKEVSTRAKTCPNCGNRHPTSSMTKGAKIGLALIGFVAVAWAIGTVSMAMDDNVSYTVVERWGNGLGQAVVIDAADRTPERLRQLCDQLETNRRNASHATIFVYDNRTAAGLRHDPRMESAAPFPEHDDHFIVSYTKNASTGINDCRMMPHGTASDDGSETISY
jgi:hypothetical protein